MGVLLAVLIPIKIVLTACGGGDPPTLVTGRFTASPWDYNCAFNAPLVLTKIHNVGLIKVSIASSVPGVSPWFATMDYTSPLIDCGASPDCCAIIQVPSSGDYTAQVRYIEYNTPTCNTGTNSCYRWWYNQTIYSGQIPSCSLPISISQIPPEGAIGPCN